MYEVLRELWKIIEWRDGSVYEAEYVEDVWIDWDGKTYATPPKGYLYVTKSNSHTLPRRKSRD